VYRKPQSTNFAGEFPVPAKKSLFLEIFSLLICGIMAQTPEGFPWS
jgi:hypothetical protein